MGELLRGECRDQRVVPLWRSTDSSRFQAAAAHELQLFDLSPPRWALGLLRSKQGQGPCPQGRSGSLRVGRQMPPALSVCELRLRYALGTNRWIQEPNGREFSQLRSLDH